MMQQYLADGVGLWRQVLSLPTSHKRPAVFLDRDGVVVEEVGFLHRVENCRLVDGATQFIAACNKRGIPVIVVTNQSGIGRGYYRWDDFFTVQSDIATKLARGGACVDMVLACAYHEDGIGPYAVANHSWRKPMGGMFYEAEKSLNLSLNTSLIIGDRATDLLAGKSAGLQRGILVRTGYGSEQQTAAALLSGSKFLIKMADSIATINDGTLFR